MNNKIDQNLVSALFIALQETVFLGWRGMRWRGLLWSVSLFKKEWKKTNANCSCNTYGNSYDWLYFQVNETNCSSETLKPSGYHHDSCWWRKHSILPTSLCPVCRTEQHTASKVHGNNRWGTNQETDCPSHYIKRDGKKMKACASNLLVKEKSVPNHSVFAW